MAGIAIAWYAFYWHSVSYTNKMLFDDESGRYKPLKRRRRRGRTEEAQPPSWAVCGDVSPDNALRCRLEVGHSGWHSHHGPVSWYMGQWAEDDFQYDWRKSNIPW